MTTTDSPERDTSIIEQDIGEALSQRFLAYAMSTITARALPDVRDGLKPVHRRLLYAMRMLRLDAGEPRKKCAKVVGQVMGDFHPHGDQAIYDALVRLAQDFSVRYPLIDGQGNFGNLDGDNAAAMRYTEARLTEIADLLLDGLNEDAVDFKANYSGEMNEPVVLPAAFPNLLANGATGIAVGMATSIPPHNLAELLDASLYLIENPDASARELVRFVPAPDFPTGGVVVEPRDSIEEAYATGRGGFRVRARWEVEELPRGGWRIIVSEIPYQVQKGKLIEELANLIELKKAPLLGDVRDESSDQVRIVIEPKVRTVTPEQLMESLFKLSELEIRFSLNMNVLDSSGAPRVMSLKDVLQAFLDHAREVAGRRAAHRLAKIERRLDMLAGLLVVYLNLDEVIRIIREEDEPKPVLMERFTLNEAQAEYILDTRLRALRRLEEMEIRREELELRDERDDLIALLADPVRQWGKVADGLRDLRARYGPDTALGRRRSAIADAPMAGIAHVEAFVAREPVTIVLSRAGWIRAAKGHGLDASALKFREGDGLAFSLEAHTTDKAVLFASDGRSFALACDKLPSARGLGEPVRLMIDLLETTDIIDLFLPRAGARRLVASSSGYGFLVAEDELVATKKAGKQVLTLGAGERALPCKPVAGDQVAVIGTNRKLLTFELSELPEMARGKGVKLLSFKDGELADVRTFSAEEGLMVTDASGRRRLVAEWKEHVGKRAGAGRIAPRGFPKSGRFEG